jgi:hypothetical protein
VPSSASSSILAADDADLLYHSQDEGGSSNRLQVFIRSVEQRRRETKVTGAPGKLENAASRVVLHDAVSLSRYSALEPKLRGSMSLCVRRNRLIQILVVGGSLYPLILFSKLLNEFKYIFTSFLNITNINIRKSHLSAYVVCRPTTMTLINERDLSDYVEMSWDMNRNLKHFAGLI